VDATFLPHGIVLEEARNVAEAMGLPPWWLNDQASAYVSSQHDAGKREVFDHPGIRVMAGRLSRACVRDEGRGSSAPSAGDLDAA
jgi:hypothetical protein